MKIDDDINYQSHRQGQRSKTQGMKSRSLYKQYEKVGNITPKIQRFQLNFKRNKRLRSVYLNVNKTQTKYQPLSFIIPGMIAIGKDDKEVKQAKYGRGKNIKDLQDLEVKINKKSNKQQSQRVCFRVTNTGELQKQQKRNRLKISHEVSLHHINIKQASPKISKTQNVHSINSINQLKLQYASNNLRTKKITKKKSQIADIRSTSQQLIKNQEKQPNSAERTKSPKRYIKCDTKQLNVENIIRRKSLKDFQLKMKEYMRRLDIEPNSKIFIFDSGDFWVKKILLDKGWVENSSKKSTMYHLKWTSKVTQIPHFKQQKTNHFAQSDQITSKIGLIKNTAKSLQLKKYIPRTYYLGSDTHLFRKDFIKTGILSLLKKVSTFIKINQNLSDLTQSIQASNLKHAFSQMMLKKQFLSDQKIQCILHIPYTIQLCYYCLCEIDKLNSQKISPFTDLSIFCQQKLSNFSRINLPYTELLDSQGSHQLTPNNKINPPTINFQNQLNHYICDRSFYRPSPQLLSLIVSLDQYFRINYPNYTVDGCNNLWIVKNGTSSKGVGIKIQNSFESIVKNSQNKLVQKYIQECLLILEPSYIGNRKFDLRVWVLVEHFSPLKISYYKEFYGRICSSKYSLNEFSNRNGHLTNYSQNKGYYENEQESVIRGSQLLTKISAIRQINYEKIFYQELQRLIKLVMEQFQDKIQSPQQCFQMFGFDILIDKQLSLHLLQVNLSPACKERVQWLSELLERMTKQMLEIVIFQSHVRENWIQLNRHVK